MVRLLDPVGASSQQADQPAGGLVYRLNAEHKVFDESFRPVPLEVHVVSGQLT